MLKSLLCLSIFIYFVYGQNCFDRGDYCTVCPVTEQLCKGLNVTGICVTASGALPTNSPCSGLVAGDPVCSLVPVNLTVFSEQAFQNFVKAQQIALAVCKNNTELNPNCCTACSSADCWCPSKCTGTGSDSKVNLKISAKDGFLICYRFCTSCAAFGRSASWCQNNCGAGHTYACEGEADCCDIVAAASVLSSWLF